MKDIIRTQAKNTTLLSCLIKRHLKGLDKADTEQHTFAMMIKMSYSVRQAMQQVKRKLP